MDRGPVESTRRCDWPANISITGSTEKRILRMASFKEVLAGLDPPLKHQCETIGEFLHLTLMDPNVPAAVERRIPAHQLADQVAFQLLVLYAVNELRRKGSLAPLEVMPAIDPAPGCFS
jgi:hypothetical protein